MNDYLIRKEKYPEFLENRREEKFRVNYRIYKIFSNFLLFGEGNIFTLFVDVTQNKKFENFFKDENWKRLRIGNEINVFGIKKVISYFCPFCSNESLQSALDKIENSNLNIDQEFLDWIGYKGEIRTGFIRIALNGGLFTEISESDDIPSFYKAYDDSFVYRNSITFHHKFRDYDFEKGTIFIQPKFTNNEFDEETLDKIEEMKSLVRYFIDSKQVFLLAPFLEELSQIINNKDLKPSRLKITKDFRIILLDYNNLEINIRHLSKALYLVFLHNYKSIDLQELKEHREIFSQFYKEISYKNNIDELEFSVDGVLTSNDKVYQHISRIKSAFCTKISPALAKLYYIGGKKNERKRIPLDRKLVIWENEVK